MIETADAPDIAALIAPLVPGLAEIRRDLHAHPELMFTERRTAKRVSEELERLGIEHKAGLGAPESGDEGTGVIAHLPATTLDQGPAVALRADMDALPILERTGAPHASTTPGVMHACGHDGHTAILLGVAQALLRLEHRPNPVTLVFQPAEEGGAGADKMCRDGALSGAQANGGGAGLGTRVARIYGLHGWPGLPLGHVATRPGPLLAATDEFGVTIRGTQTHAAYPHLGHDPIVGAAHVVTALQTISSRRVSPVDPVIVTVGTIHGGTANNVIPESVELVGTVRTLNDDTRAQAERDLREICEHTARAHGCAAEIAWHEGYPVTHNDPGEAERVRDIAVKAFGEARYEPVETPTMGGEDFSYYGRHARACFFLIGLCPPGADPEAVPGLHQPEFDFNDDAIPVGVEMLVRLALTEDPS